jgi:hypothetical protein
MRKSTLAITLGLLMGSGSALAAEAGTGSIEARLAALEQRLQAAEQRATNAEKERKPPSYRQKTWRLNSRKRKPPRQRWRSAPRNWSRNHHRKVDLSSMAMPVLGY